MTDIDKAVEDFLAAITGATTNVNGHGGDVALTPLETLRHNTLSSEEVKALPPPEWLVDDLLVRASLGLFFGKWGLGKSFYAVDLALCLGTGIPFHGHNVKRCETLYVVAEGVGGIGKRITAWEEHHDVKAAGVHWHRRAINLLDPGWGGALSAFVVELGVSLVIIDTLSRCAPGGDLDGSKDAGLVIEQCSKIIEASGATVLLVHHPGKDATRGARGSSAFPAALDTEIELSGEDNDLMVEVTKQKDGPDGQKWHFQRVAIAESCVLLEAAEQTDDMPVAALKALDTLREIYVPGGVGVTVWLASSGIAASSFYRYRQILLEREFVRNLGSKHQARYQPISKDGRWPTD